MIIEITFGYITKSMALLSDGWHMSSHVIAIGASWLVYKYVLRQNKKILIQIVIEY
jgi:Co/Zn/Cd efflux system component